MHSENYELNTKQDTEKLAEKIAGLVSSESIILLKGDLGVGKTFFVNAFINYIYKQEKRKAINITSPTFNLLKTYEANNFKIYHFDLYRIKNPNELYELDIEEAFANVALIEWPEIVEPILPFKTIEINFQIIEQKRICKVIYY